MCQCPCPLHLYRDAGSDKALEGIVVDTEEEPILAAAIGVWVGYLVFAFRVGVVVKIGGVLHGEARVVALRVFEA